MKLSLYSTEAFSAERGARDGATKVMIVVTDGESHDGDELADALDECEKRNITRYAIAVSARHIIILLTQATKHAAIFILILL